MKGRIRIAHVASVVVFFGLVAVTTTASAGTSTASGTDPRQESTSAVPRHRGFSDFGLSYTSPAVLRTAAENPSQHSSHAR